jgi:hypothetical protein
LAHNGQIQGSLTRGILLLTRTRRRNQNVWQVGVNLPG